jgi:preprotein translocase subunit Sec63
MVSNRSSALKILGLDEGASDDEVRAAYKRLSIQWCARWTVGA